MAASLVTEFQPLPNRELSVKPGDENSSENCIDVVSLDDEAGLDKILDQEFPGLGVDFDFCTGLELGGVDLSLDIWNNESTNNVTGPNNDDTNNTIDFDINQKGDENFSLEDEFNQMLNDWDQLNESVVDDFLPACNDVPTTSLSTECDVNTPQNSTPVTTINTDYVWSTSTQSSSVSSPVCSESESVAVAMLTSAATDSSQQTDAQPQFSQQTVTLKKPSNFGLAVRNLNMLSQARQLPLSTTLKTPVVTRGFCYTTKSGGLGMSRAVQSNGIISSNPKVTISNQFSVCSTLKQEDNASQLFFTPLSPIRSPVSSSNAPDVFVASTRPTAEVIRSSSYNKISSVSKNQSNTNPEMFSKYTQQQQQQKTSRSSSPVKIIAAVSPRSDGTSCTKIFSSNSSIRDSLPKELIDKIRAASQGRKTIAIIEPINRKEPSTQPVQVSNEIIQRQKQQQQQARYNSSISQIAVGWKSSSAIHNLVNNVSDHDYCSPTGFSRFSRKYITAQNKVMRQMEEMKSKQSATTQQQPARMSSPAAVTDEGETKKDSGLESCEMSDCSEDGTYDKLPRYLTNVSVQTDSRPPTGQDEPGYNRLPAYLFKPQQSLLKSNLSKSVVEKHNIVVSPVNISDQKLEDKPVISLAAESSIVQSTAVQVDSKIKMDVQVDDHNVISRLSTTTTTSSGVETNTPAAINNNNKNTSTNKNLSSHVDKPGNKRRRDSIDSSSDETDSTYRRSLKRKRAMFLRDGKLRTSSRDRRKKYRDRSRSRSSSTERSKSRSEWTSSRDKERTNRRHKFLDKKIAYHQQQQQQLLDQKALSEERKIVYVGNIAEGILKSDLRNRFETFGPILDISLHFRERGVNYGFLTFKNIEDAKEAIEHGNDEIEKPKYDLCFGGRRKFCREEYYDLDDVEDLPTTSQLPFDELLRKARREIKK